MCQNHPLRSFAMPLLLMVLGIVLCSPCLAIAQHSGSVDFSGVSFPSDSDNATKMFQAADGNHDHRLSKSELKSFIIKRIKQAVGDKITKKQLKKLLAQVPAKVNRFFDAADKNGDNALSLDEFKNIARKLT